MRNLPYDINTIKKLSLYLEVKLEQNSCNNLLFFTMEFINQNHLPLQNLVKWLRINRIDCDCKVYSRIKKYTERMLYVVG